MRQQNTTPLPLTGRPRKTLCPEGQGKALPLCLSGERSLGKPCGVPFSKGIEQWGWQRLADSGDCREGAKPPAEGSRGDFPRTLLYRVKYNVLYFTYGEEIGKEGGKVGYAVVHMMKIKAGSMGGIQSHNNREHPSRSNPDIDPERTKDNYDLVPCDNYRGEFRRKVSELVESKKAVRKDAVAVCNFIVTSDKDTMAGMGADGQRAFFEDSVKWFADRYGADRILNATVHMDEATPHLHIGVVPITADGRLSAKAIFTKTELTAIQTEFARDVGAQYGLERGIEGSENTHLSETRYKLEMARQELAQEQERLQGLREDAEQAETEAGNWQEVAAVYEQEADKAQQKLLEARESLSDLQGDINTLAERKTALEGEIEALEGIKASLQAKVDALKDTAAAALLRVQERLERALLSVSERTRGEFTAAWKATKDVTIEQAVKPKRKERE